MRYGSRFSRGQRGGAGTALWGELQKVSLDTIFRQKCQTKLPPYLTLVSKTTGSSMGQWWEPTCDSAISFLVVWTHSKT